MILQCGCLNLLTCVYAQVPPSRSLAVLDFCAFVTSQVAAILAWQCAEK